MRKLLIYFMTIFPLWASATTTGGGTARNVLIDGIVSTGAATGTNGTDWELDEVFQGFAGQVDWFVTWDDQNLYLGRIGGNNAEGSVIYIHADYTGSTTSNRAFNNYDGLSPEVSPMGGVNFGAYIKDSYDEFRTWNAGAWDPVANLSLAPSFNFQSGSAHMEVTIPWDAITNNNGKPTNIRILLYQIVPNASAPTCIPDNHFVYGESPWGTGNAGDGPSIGVNDGQPISARQPGGCGVGQDTATRWWGCYPVIGGVGSNGWAAQQPYAGPDTTICESATAYFMLGNLPNAQTTGTWSLVSAPGGATPVINNPNDPFTTVQGMTALGTYTFVWDINYGGCPSLPDTVRVTRGQAPPAADAGPNQTLDCNITNATLSGNDPGAFSGSWSLLSGQASINSPNDSLSTISNLGIGANTFLWTIQGGVCPAAVDTVVLFRYANVFADAGPDQELCAASLSTMTALDPQGIQSTATGQWTQFSGPASVTFTDNTSHVSNISNLSSGTFQLIWTVSNGNCPSASDTMTIVVYSAPIADAGPDRSYCSSAPILLDANDPSALGTAASGVWRLLSGPSVVQFADSNAYNSSVSGLTAGTYRFAWILSNGNCPDSYDIVNIIVSELLNNGLDSLRNPVRGQFDGYVEVANPLNGAPPFLFSLDGGSYQPDSTFANLGPGSYTVTIIDNNGCVDDLDFVLSEVDPPIPPSGPDTLFIPDAFSPNGDGVNDSWEILGIDEYPEASIEIYNIWGGLIFSSEGGYTPWTGQYQSKDMPQANYYYIVNLHAQGLPVYKGTLTLFR